VVAELRTDEASRISTALESATAAVVIDTLPLPGRPLIIDRIG
jgi:hypothetical protein